MGVAKSSFRSILRGDTNHNKAISEGLWDEGTIKGRVPVRYWSVYNYAPISGDSTLSCYVLDGEVAMDCHDDADG